MVTSILLINPSYAHVDKKLAGGVWHTQPLGLAYIAAVLKREGYEVKILDLDVEKEDPVRVCEELQPSIVGITCTTPTFNLVSKLCEEIKSNFSTTTVVGGAHPSSVPELVIKDENIDIIIRGEGELTMLELVDNIENNNKNFSKIKGIAFKKNKKIIQTPQRELIKDLDTLPFPARDLLPLEKYPSHIYSLKEPGVSMITSRGCPYNCTFCCKNVFGRTFRGRSAKNVVDEMEEIIEKYKAREILIVDDTFTLSKDRTINICKEIVSREIDIPWFTPNGTRADDLDEETIRWVKKAGCHCLFFGVESGSQKIVDRIKKGIKLEKIEKTVKLCKKYEINVGLFFMIGLPDETERDIKKTIKFAKKLEPDIVKFGVTVPLPNTELFEEWDRKGFIRDYNFKNYFWHSQPVFETEYLSAEQIINFYKQAYREFYLDPKYILRQFYKIRSLTQLKKRTYGFMGVIRNQFA
jgi:radical SAM superfamily enzyme YgiQ (UPF0313 family)